MVTVDELRQMSDKEYLKKIEHLFKKNLLEKVEVEKGTAWVYYLHNQAVVMHDYDKKVAKGALCFVRPIAFQK